MAQPREPAPEPARLRWFDWKILPAVAVTALLLWLLLGRLGGYGQVAQTLAGARWELLGAALATISVHLVVAAFRWKAIVHAMGYALPLGAALRAMFAAWPFALLTPSRAGDVIRAWSIRRLVPPLTGAGSVLAEKLMDIQVLCVLALGASLLAGLYLWALVTAGLLVSSWVAFAVFARAEGLALRLSVLRRFAPKVAQLSRAFAALVAQPRALATALGLSLASWSLGITLVQILLVMTGAGVEPLTTVSLWPLAIFAGMVPITLAGMGTRDAAFVYLLRATSTTEVDGGAVVTATIAYALIGTWLIAIIGLPFAVRLSMDLSKLPPKTPDDA
ncbi:MAG: flippase-like domain-containing protein [Myxococcales bacterium]|nr:flippase-like domain-containing protein [Myxococcales bacterium]